MQMYEQRSRFYVSGSKGEKSLVSRSSEKKLREFLFAAAETLRKTMAYRGIPGPLIFYRTRKRAGSFETFFEFTIEK